MFPPDWVEFLGNRLDHPSQVRGDVDHSRVGPGCQDEGFCTLASEVVRNFIFNRLGPCSFALLGAQS